MEIFFAREIDGSFCHLTEEESAHCVKVMRHREGDEIHVIDGEGTFYTCRLCDASPKSASARIVEVEKDWGAHPYRLTMAVCPTKNNDRYEWFAEKATEMGLDVIAPVIGDHSERRVFKTERLGKILLAASKQSLKGAVPHISEPVSVKEFIKNADADVKLICWCFEEQTLRRSIKEVLDEKAAANSSIAILIGPEGDFSRDEARLAMDSGFIPVHLGDSRLRTETAAIAATAAVYFNYMK